MPKRSATLLLEDILAAIGKIERYTSGLDQAAFMKDEKTVDAVVRNLEIVGEASRQLPENFKNRHGEIPWRAIGGLRNRVVHDYMGVDLQIVWHVVENELGTLKQQIRALPLDR